MTEKKYTVSESVQVFEQLTGLRRSVKTIRRYYTGFKGIILESEKPLGRVMISETAIKCFISATSIDQQKRTKTKTRRQIKPVNVVMAELEAMGL